MHDMRKFHHHLTFGRSDAPVKSLSTWAGSSHVAPLALTVCKPFQTKTNYRPSFANGVRSVTLFPDTSSLFTHVDPNGLVCDWVRVGQALQFAMDTWSSEEEPEIDPDDLTEGDLEVA